jgi:hypothetical protein
MALALAPWLIVIVVCILGDVCEANTCCLTAVTVSLQRPGYRTVMESPGLNFNLLDQLTFYGSYHSRGWNQVIHFIFVPLIHWSLTVWLAYLPPPTNYDLPPHLDFLPDVISR